MGEEAALRRIRSPISEVGGTVRDRIDGTGIGHLQPKGRTRTPKRCAISSERPFQQIGAAGRQHEIQASGGQLSGKLRAQALLSCRP